MQDPKLPGQCGQEDFDKVIRNYRVMKHEVNITWNQAPPFDMLQMLFDVGSFYKSGEIFGNYLNFSIFTMNVFSWLHESTASGAKSDFSAIPRRRDGAQAQVRFSSPLFSNEGS